MRVINDFISGIKVIKMFAWESAFRKRISNVRRSVVDLLHIAIVTSLFCLHLTLLGKKQLMLMLQHSLGPAMMDSFWCP